VVDLPEYLGPGYRVPRFRVADVSGQCDNPIELKIDPSARAEAQDRALESRRHRSDRSAPGAPLGRHHPISTLAIRRPFCEGSLLALAGPGQEQSHHRPLDRLAPRIRDRAVDRARGGIGRHLSPLPGSRSRRGLELFAGEDGRGGLPGGRQHLRSCGGRLAHCRTGRGFGPRPPHGEQASDDDETGDELPVHCGDSQDRGR